MYVYLWMCWPKLDLHNIIHVTKSLVCIISFLWYISTCVCVLYKWISILSCEYYNDVQYTVYILKSFVSMSFNVINKVYVFCFLLFLLNHSFEYRYFFFQLWCLSDSIITVLFFSLFISIMNFQFNEIKHYYYYCVI